MRDLMRRDLDPSRYLNSVIQRLKNSKNSKFKKLKKHYSNKSAIQTAGNRDSAPVRRVLYPAKS